MTLLSIIQCDGCDRKEKGPFHPSIQRFRLVKVGGETGPPDSNTWEADLCQSCARKATQDPKEWPRAEAAENPALRGTSA